ncbi:probable splicing factor, arginine/serine-rich 4 [Hibiscus syriacus]|uniref:probable splicing factor, arginine/serine-rich 4 n=1 Tax=Hibiscus syriacus TaxID=106335 RepID=UPI00192310D4|nr:probable splicing factor, arginine/serine-rich 4 [Hibiscus syriacus]
MSEKVRERVSEKSFGSASSDKNISGPGGVFWVAFVDNLSRNVTRSALWDRFSRQSKVIKVFIPLVNKRSNYKYCTFAFVHFASREDLLYATDRMNNVLIDGRKISVSIAKYQRKSNQRSSVHNRVVGVRGDGSEEQNGRSAKTRFKDGEIRSVSIADDGGKRKGRGSR